MPRFNEIINNFINGEVSPRLYGRSDSDIYKRSCRNVDNMFIYPQGGAARRPGTEFILDRVINSGDTEKVLNTSGCRIIPFIYSKDESYLIIFHGMGTLDYNYFFNIYNPKTNMLSAPFFTGGSSGGFAGDSVGAGAVSGNLLDTDSVLKDIQYAQNGNVIIFTHPDFPPFYLKLVGTDNFVCADFYRPTDDFTLAYTPSNEALWRHWPFDTLNITSTTFTMTATTGTTTVTSSSPVFSADLVGSLFYITDSGVIGTAMFTGYTSPTVMSCEVLKTMPGTSAYTSWGLSSWSKVKGYPRSVTFLGNRAIYGFTKANPEKIWYSQAFDIYELSNTRVLVPGSTVVDDDPGSFVIASTEANEGQWLRGSGRGLLAGTRGREYYIAGVSGTLKSIDSKPQTSYGSENVQPAIVDDVPIFVQRGFRKLREMLYDFRSDGYVSNDVTFHAEHIFRKSQELLGDNYISKIKQMAYQPLDNNLLWIIDTNGYLYSCTKSRENTVNAFSKHSLGGNYQGNFPKVLSIASIPSTSGTGDDLYLLVLRTIAGTDVVYLERVNKEFYATSLYTNNELHENQPIFLDCAKVFRPHSANFWAPLTQNENAKYAGGLTTGTTTGTINYTDKIARIGAATSYITWDGTSNADFPQVGTIKFKLHRFDLINTGSLNTIFCISKAAADTHNLIKIQIDCQGAAATFGDVILTIKSSTDTFIINNITIGNLLGTQNIGILDFQLEYDITIGLTSLYINGVQLGVSITSTGTRDSAIDLIRLNADQAGSQSQSGWGYSDLRIFSLNQNAYGNFELFPHAQETVVLDNLDHLEEEVVSVVGDGNYIGDFTVNVGAITLPAIYSTVIVGLKYTHTIEIQPVDAGTGIGSSIGSIKRIDRAMVRFNSSAAAKIGPSISLAEEVIFRDSATPMADPTTLVTDDKILEFPGDYDRQARCVVTHDAPLPCNVTCISLRGVTEDV